MPAVANVVEGWKPQLASHTASVGSFDRGSARRGIKYCCEHFRERYKFRNMLHWTTTIPASRARLFGKASS